MILDTPEKFGVNDEGKKLLDVCFRNVNRLNNLIGDILDISRLEAGGMKFSFQRFNILKLLQEEVADFKAAAKQKGLTFTSLLPKEMPEIIGDKSRIEQVTGNLLKNAIKFTDKGSVTINASISAENIEISVQDTGMGISKLDVPKLFTKFFQGEDITTRKTKGSGLGLVISREIARAHGGDIAASSPGKGKGSTFTVTLPIKGKLTPNETQQKQDTVRENPLTELDEAVLMGKRKKLSVEEKLPVQKKKVKVVQKPIAITKDVVPPKATKRRTGENKESNSIKKEEKEEKREVEQLPGESMMEKDKKQGDPPMKKRKSKRTVIKL